MSRDGEDFHLSLRFVLGTVIFLIFGWMSLLATHPMVWAVGTGVALLLVFGFLTSKILFRIQNHWLAFALAPLFGSCWLLFFVLVIYLPQWMGT